MDPNSNFDAWWQEPLNQNNHVGEDTIMNDDPIIWENLLHVDETPMPVQY